MKKGEKYGQYTAQEYEIDDPAIFFFVMILDRACRDAGKKYNAKGDLWKNGEDNDCYCQDTMWQDAQEARSNGEMPNSLSTAWWVFNFIRGE